jgi:ribonuclease HII
LKDQVILNKYEYEEALIADGYQLIAGVDEVGRGPLIGPVVSAAVILPVNCKIEGLDDSKKLSEKKRLTLFDEIKEKALSISIVSVDAKTIDEINIYQASKKAMIEAIDKLDPKPEHVLVDAMPLDIEVDTTSIIKGDAKSLTIAAASVIAKVTRDEMMYKLDEEYPQYGFKRHKGYPTKEHLAMLKEHGILDTHRRSFGPVRDIVNEQLKLDF